MDSKTVVSCQLSVVSCYRKGLTLPEVLIGIGLIGIIGVLIAAVMFAHLRLFANQSTTIDIASQNKLALDELASQIRESESIVTSCCNPQETTSANSLVLRLWAIDNTGEPIASAFDYMIYKHDPQNPTKLVKKTVPDPASTRIAQTKVIATSLAGDGLTFTLDNADPTQASEVNVTIKTTATSGTKTHTITQSAKAVLRNK